MLVVPPYAIKLYETYAHLLTIRKMNFDKFKSVCQEKIFFSSNSNFETRQARMVAIYSPSKPRIGSIPFLIPICARFVTGQAIGYRAI